MKKPTQRDRAIERMKEVGYVDNFWAFHNYILRLGAVMHKIKEDVSIEADYGCNITNFEDDPALRLNYYYFYPYRGKKVDDKWALMLPK